MSAILARSRALPALLCALTLCAASGATASEPSSLYTEASAVLGYSERDEWFGEAPGSQRNAVGFEYFRKFSNERGDFLTCDVQARLSYDFSDDREPWALEIHNAWADYKLGLGSDIRAGHFSPAFGLEPVVDTHATLLQTLAGQDIGYKKDWGLGYRGIAGAFDYQVAAQLGSGMGIERKDGSYLLTARAANPPVGDLRYGLSALLGRVLVSVDARTIPKPRIRDDAVFKKRIGADLMYEAGSLLVKAEATVGADGTHAVAGTLLEANYTPPSLQSLTLKAQGRFWIDLPGTTDAGASSAALAASYRLAQTWTLGVAVFHDLAKPGPEDTRMVVQAYYYGG